MTGNLDDYECKGLGSCGTITGYFAGKCRGPECQEGRALGVGSGRIDGRNRDYLDPSDAIDELALILRG